LGGGWVVEHPHHEAKDRTIRRVVKPSERVLISRGDFPNQVETRLLNRSKLVSVLRRDHLDSPSHFRASSKESLERLYTRFRLCVLLEASPLRACRLPAQK